MTWMYIIVIARPKGFKYYSQRVSFTQKMKLCLHLLPLMSFQTCNTHLQNTNKDILMIISVPPLTFTQLPLILQKVVKVI